MAQDVPVTVAHGDGIGPEIMAATLQVLEAAGARLALQTITIGQKIYEGGVSSGIEPTAWETLRRTRVFLKAPITTPLGGGFKSLNVTTRTALGLYANVRPCVSYYPFIQTKHPKMNVVIIRENEEGMYTGIEHRLSDEVIQSLKLVSRPGCEKIIRYAFEYARHNNRGKVTCFTKDNIMKMTDGLFHRVFEKIAAEYPAVEHEHLIIDIGAARLAAVPEQFDVIVTLNLYGDIISDIAAEIAGSVGLAGSANIGSVCAMFEAIHGSAPSIAGRNIANPSGLLLAAVMMLVHLGQVEAAQRLHNAWLRTIEDGIHTADVFTQGLSRELVGTQQFARAVVARLGQEPGVFTPVNYTAIPQAAALVPADPPGAANKELVGVDVYLCWNEAGRDPGHLAGQVEKLAGPELKLQTITNRGVKVWPGGMPETFCTDHWRCRFLAAGGGAVSAASVVALLGRMAAAGLDFVQTSHLYTFDGERGYALAANE